MEHIDELLMQYITFQEQEGRIKKAKEELKNSIVEALAEKGLTSYENGSLKGSVAMKSTVKYDDEPAIIEYLQNNGMGRFVKTVIDTTNFNKTLKSSQTLQESLKGKYSVTESPALTVKRL